MELIQDLKVIAELSKKYEDDNWHFRAFLKQTEMSIEELDAIVYRLYEDVSSQIDCTACGNCCRETAPLLCGDDITKLASELAVSTAEIAEKYLDPDEDEKDAFIFNKIPCPFLSENRCTVYPSRPADCRSYPHLHKKQFLGRLISVIHNCSVCPIVFNLIEQLKNRVWDTSSIFQDEMED